MYAFIKNNVVVGLSEEPTGIPDYDTMCGVDEFQIVAIGDTVVEGAFVGKNNLPSFCLSKLKFMNRFTLYELAAIEAASDPILKVLQRQQEVADFIDLKDSKTLEGLSYLVAVGILSEVRMAEILKVD